MRSKRLTNTIKRKLDETCDKSKLAKRSVHQKNRNEMEYAGNEVGSSNHCVTRDTAERSKTGYLIFRDYPDFRPNKTPKEVMQAGSFGGGYFRNIKSGVTKEDYKDVWKEFPSDWFEGLKINLQVANPTYDKSVNKYKVKCGASLTEWEGSGWIKAQDPYGWFHWYCRFYLGRRTSDDQRQLARWKSFDGRWKSNLINRIRKANTSYDDFTISPAIRQSLLHWGIEVTKADLTIIVRKNSEEEKQKLLALVPLT